MHAYWHVLCMYYACILSIFYSYSTTLSCMYRLRIMLVLCLYCACILLVSRPHPDMEIPWSPWKALWWYWWCIGSVLGVLWNTMYCECILHVFYSVLDMYFTHPRCQNTHIIRPSHIGHVSGRIPTYSTEYMYCTCIVLYCAVLSVVFCSVYWTCFQYVCIGCILHVLCMHSHCIWFVYSCHMYWCVSWVYCVCIASVLLCIALLL